MKRPAVTRAVRNRGWSTRWEPTCEVLARLRTGAPSYCGCSTPRSPSRRSIGGSGGVESRTLLVRPLASSRVDRRSLTSAQTSMTLPTDTRLAVGSVSRETSRLPAPGSRLPAPGSRLPAPGSRLPAPGSRLPAPGSRLPADYQLPPALFHVEPVPVSFADFFGNRACDG